MKRKEIEFVAGFVIGRYAVLHGWTIDNSDGWFEPWVIEQVTDALVYIDNDKKFEADALAEIQEILDKTNEV